MSDNSDIRDLMARVGTLLLHWGRVEYEIQAPPPAAKLSAQVAIRKWARAHADRSNNDERHRQRVRQLMLDFGKVRKLRNLIAHGMIDAYGATENFRQPTLKCLSIESDIVLIEAGELDAAIAALAEMLPDIRALNEAAGLGRRRAS